VTGRGVTSALAVAFCVAGILGQAMAAPGAAAPATRVAEAGYDEEIGKIRALVGGPGTHDQAMDQLAAIAIRAANDLEIALARGDVRRVASLDRLIREKLGDTRWRVERRAEKGDADALLALGMFYARNLLAARNIDRACTAFAKAAEHDSIAGRYQAALCLLKTEPERAAALMQRAADAGHPAAQEAIGRACLERKPNPELACAERNLDAAAKAGRPSAQSLLGWMYANGAGVPRDARRASELYLEAARSGDPAAQNNLGELYEKGNGVRKNARLAASWYLQAAQAGFGAAQFNLGRMYALGVGVERDPAKARAWLEKARAQGIAPANDLIGWIDRRDDRGRDK
jgi:TPR repeat protein